MQLLFLYAYIWKVFPFTSIYKLFRNQTVIFKCKNQLNYENIKNFQPHTISSCIIYIV